MAKLTVVPVVPVMPVVPVVSADPLGADIPFVAYPAIGLFVCLKVVVVVPVVPILPNLLLAGGAFVVPDLVGIAFD